MWPVNTVACEASRVLQLEIKTSAATWSGVNALRYD